MQLIINIDVKRLSIIDRSQLSLQSHVPRDDREIMEKTRLMLFVL